MKGVYLDDPLVRIESGSGSFNRVLLHSIHKPLIAEHSGVKGFVVYTLRISVGSSPSRM